VDCDDRVEGGQDDACVERVDDADTFLPLFGVDEPALADADFFRFVPVDGLLVLKPWLIWRGNDFVTLAMALSIPSGFSCV
jgi:hypothetical protein